MCSSTRRPSTTTHSSTSPSWIFSTPLRPSRYVLSHLLFPPSNHFCQVAVAYKDPTTGETLDHFPAGVDTLADLEVVYKEFEGWQKPTTAAKTFVSDPVPVTGALTDRQTVRLAQAGTCLHRVHWRVCGCARWMGRNWSCAGRHDCSRRGGRCLGIGLLFGPGGGGLEWLRSPCLTDTYIT